jgi:hypothetical protein
MDKDMKGDVELVKNVEEVSAYPASMPNVNGKEFPYTAKGMAMAKMEAKKKGKKMVAKPAKKKMGKKK